MSPKNFAMRPPGKALRFSAVGLYPGYRLDGPEATKMLEWLDEYRYWQMKLGSPYIPHLSYRFDLATYAQEPDDGWKSFDSAYVRVPQSAIDAKLETFRAAGWNVRVVGKYADWEPKTRRTLNGVEMAVLPYCKGESNRRKDDPNRQKRCARQAAIIDPTKIISQIITHCLAATRLCGVDSVGLACKRAFYSPDEAGRFKRVFGPGPEHTEAGGPLLAPPFEHGQWDSAFIQLARALREERIFMVKQERPRGFPDATGATWLPADLRPYVTEMAGPERL